MLGWQEHFQHSFGNLRNGGEKKKKKPEGRMCCIYVLSRGNVVITAHSCTHKTGRVSPTLKDHKTSQLLINQITQTTWVELT